MNKPIRFVVDGACDVPQTLVEKHQMTVIPAYVNYEGESYADNGVEFNRRDYYEQLPNIHPIPHTSGPSSGMAQEMMENALETASHLVIVTTSAKLSGIHNAVRLGAAALPDNAYTLIDSGSVSLGAAFQAILGAEKAAQSYDLQAVIATVHDVARRQSIYAALPSVKYLRRGGRVSWATAMVGNLLRIRPIVQIVDGVVEDAGRVRTHKKWVGALERIIRAQAPLERIAFLHTNNEDDIQTVRESVIDLLPDAHQDVMSVIATPSVGTHTGPGAIGVATVRR